MMDKFKVGMSATTKSLVTDDSIRKFSDVSGDVNPVHLSDEYASKTIFKKRIAPGIQIASYISAILANKLPGEGSIYIEQSLKFKKPVYIGDIVETQVTITEINGSKINLKTEQFNQLGEKVVEGCALIKYMGNI